MPLSVCFGPDTVNVLMFPSFIGLRCNQFFICSQALCQHIFCPQCNLFLLFLPLTLDRGVTQAHIIYSVYPDSQAGGTAV